MQRCVASGLDRQQVELVINNYGVWQNDFELVETFMRRNPGDQINMLKIPGVNMKNKGGAMNPMGGAWLKASAQINYLP